MARRSFLCVAAATLLSATPALAHHAFSADFDINKPIRLDGTLTKIEWTKPHAHLYLDTTDTAGKTTNWKIELGGNNDLDQYGWTTTLLKVGQEVTMQGWQAKNGSTFANADTVTLAGGLKLWAASSYHPEFGRTGTLARNIREPGAMATRGVDGDGALPETGSPLSFVGLLGSLSFLVALALKRANR